MVEVVDDRFWDGLPQVQFGSDTPALDSNVSAVGYPMGGDNISITRGVVSRSVAMLMARILCCSAYLILLARVDLMDYTMLGLGDPPLLTIQIDAAINPGNSGGPVFDDQMKVRART